MQPITKISPGNTVLWFWLLLSKRIFLNLFSSHTLRSTGDCLSSEPRRLVLVTKMLVTHLLFSSPCWAHFIQFWAPPYKENTGAEVSLRLEFCEERLKEGDSLSLGRGWLQTPTSKWPVHAQRWWRRWSQVHGRGWGTEMRDAQTGQSPDWPSLSSWLNLHCAAVLTRALLWPLPTLSYDPEIPIWQLMIIQTQRRRIL